MFVNHSDIDFSIDKNRELFKAALSEVQQTIEQGGFKTYPIISGHDTETALVVPREDPSEAGVQVGTVAFAGKQELDKALASLNEGASTWKSTTIEERAAILQKAAEIMSERIFFLSAIMVREVGKPWAESYHDVAEAIDFCNYYAQEILRIGTPRRTMELLGEENTFYYRPRGISAVIAPWNFPCAIACGMTTASLVAGNPTILKPAEQSSIIGYELSKILLEAGVPENVFAFLPGTGEEIGRSLVNHDDVTLVAFTGSKQVGLEIIKRAGEVPTGAKFVKKVIAELGGKNAIIIDENADLDEAIKGVTYSAFGFSGQKCSACSRVIVVGDAYERFMKRLVNATSALIVGEPRLPGTFVGPVIDEDSFKRLQTAIEKAKGVATLAYEGEWIDDGFFVPPTIFRDVDPSSDLWREELFGPVLCCASVKTFEEAIELANDSEYALTGGLFSRSPNNIERAAELLEVGNLYINRSCTGAIVGRQPFGGYKMSGIGAKAGGPNYLVQFMVPLCISENTMRRGCAPELA